MAQFNQEKMEAIKQTHFNALAESLTSMRIKEKSDVTLMCGEVLFFAHRCILEAASPYFMKMFSCNLEESKSGVISFESTKPETLEAILDFIYTGKVEHIHCEELLKSVLITSHLMQLEELVLYCRQALMLLLTLDNFFVFLDIGLKYELEGWRTMLVNFWIINSSKLIDRDTFLEVEISMVKELFSFVKSKRQCLDVMLMGCLNWLRHDFEPREMFIDEMFDCVDAKLVRQEFVRSWLNDNTVMTISQNFANHVEKLSIEILTKGSEPPDESVLLDVCSWKTKLAYFSQFREVDVFDPLKNLLMAPRSESLFCVQRFDLCSMTWLPLQIPESSNMVDFKHMYQFGEMIYMINETHMGCYDIKSNGFRAKKLKHILPLGDGLAVFKGHVYTNYNKHIIYSTLGSCEWKQAGTFPFFVNSVNLLSSTEYLYVIGINPELAEEFIIQYSSNPSDEASKWEVIRIAKVQLQPTDFFVYNNSLNAFVFVMEAVTTRCLIPRLKLLTYNHVTREIKVNNHERPTALTDIKLKLSRFQDFRSPYVFFTTNDSNFSIPKYIWQPDTGVWTKTNVRKGRRRIPDDPSVKLIYSVDK